MTGTPKTNQVAACPYCNSHLVVLDSAEDEITIVCPQCHGHYSVNTRTMRTTKRRSGGKAKDNDNETPLLHKLRCPYGCGYSVLNKTPVDTIISVMCPKCKKIFRANLQTGRTWPSKSQPNGSNRS